MNGRQSRALSEGAMRTCFCVGRLVEVALPGHGSGLELDLDCDGEGEVWSRWQKGPGNLVSTKF